VVRRANPSISKEEAVTVREAEALIGRGGGQEFTYEGVRRVGLLAHDPGHAGVERDGHPGRPPHVRLPGRPVRRVDVAVLVLDLPRRAPGARSGLTQDAHEHTRQSSTRNGPGTG
jgi:hypothetical protein